MQENRNKYKKKKNMMNINQNKELNQIQTLEGNIQDNFQIPEGATFKDEFNKLLDNGVDGSFLVQTVPINPVLDFQNSFDIETIEIDTKEIENTDAMFFLNIAANSDTQNLQIKDETSVIDAANYKTMEISKTVGDLILRAQENNKAVRLDFDNRVTVVLRVAKDGKIDATFFPQEKEVENYLKNNIDYLKVRFDEQNIAYSNISYKPYRQNKQNNNNNNQGDKQDEWCIR